MMSNSESLREMLENISDSYPDFVSGIMLSMENDNHVDRLIEFISDNPEADTSAIIAYVDDELNPV